MYRLMPEQLSIVQRIADLAEQHVAPHAARIDRERVFPRESLTALGEQGFLGLTVPAAFGGLGQGVGVMTAALDEVARRCASTAMVYLMHLCGIACYATASDKTAAYLQAAARGQHLSTLAFSESGSRSHFWTPVSRARSGSGGLRLDARKSFVTAAGEADGYVVSTLDAGATQPFESTIYLVLRGDPGVGVEGAWTGMGCAATRARR